MNKEIEDKINEWLTKSFDKEIHDEINNLKSLGEENELYDRFYKNLDFGTGGLRGKMGAGTNRMNIYTVAMATQGLSNYIKSIGENAEKKGVVIAFDSRNNSKLFAMHAARVLAANKIKTFVFSDIRPTPLLSFAVRKLKAISGIVVTASHNPPLYNGYKVYWEDGAQITPPHDKNIIKHVNKIKNINEVKIIETENAIKDGLIEILDNTIENSYYEEITKLSLNPDNNKKYSNIKIAFSPIHGTGITMVEKALNSFGFNNIHIVESQKAPNGNFPTVKYPNPEEHDAMKEVLDLAKRKDADIAFATDPDADRIGVAAKNSNGEFKLFNGNQIASLLNYYVLKRHEETGKLDTQNDFIVKTIVTTDLMKKISEGFKTEIFEVLTGFKWIGLKIKELQDNSGKRFLYGGEESYGYLLGSLSRDKDAIIISALIVETLAYAYSQNKNLFSMLDDIYNKYGYYLEKLKSLTFEGFEGTQKIQDIMTFLREKTPEKIGDYVLKELIDYNLGKNNLPKSNVLLLTLKDGSKIFARPSGTEPKIKFYFMTHENAESDNLDNVKKETDKKMQIIMDSFFQIIHKI